MDQNHFKAIGGETLLRSHVVGVSGLERSREVMGDCDWGVTEMCGKWRSREQKSVSLFQSHPSAVKSN